MYVYIHIYIGENNGKSWEVHPTCRMGGQRLFKFTCVYQLLYIKSWFWWVKSCFDWSDLKTHGLPYLSPPGHGMHIRGIENPKTGHAQGFKSSKESWYFSHTDTQMVGRLPLQIAGTPFSQVHVPHVTCYAKNRVPPNSAADHGFRHLFWQKLLSLGYATNFWTCLPSGKWTKQYWHLSVNRRENDLLSFM